MVLEMSVFPDEPIDIRYYEGEYESIAETVITLIIKFTYIMGTSFTKLRLFFLKSLHYQNTFSAFV